MRGLSEKQYNNKLQSAIKRYYSTDQMDEFEWFGDEETEETYSFVFVDHKKKKRKLTYYKDDGHLSLLPTV